MSTFTSASGQGRLAHKIAATTTEGRHVEHRHLLCGVEVEYDAQTVRFWQAEVVNSLFWCLYTCGCRVPESGKHHINPLLDASEVRAT